MLDKAHYAVNSCSQGDYEILMGEEGGKVNEGKCREKIAGVRLRYDNRVSWEKPCVGKGGIAQPA